MVMVKVTVTILDLRVSVDAHGDAVEITRLPRGKCLDTNLPKITRAVNAFGLHAARREENALIELV